MICFCPLKTEISQLSTVLKLYRNCEYTLSHTLASCHNSVVLNKSLFNAFRVFYCISSFCVLLKTPYCIITCISCYNLYKSCDASFKILKDARSQAGRGNVPVKSKLQHPLPSIPRAFDGFPVWEGGHLITTHRGRGIRSLASISCYESR